MALTKYNIGQLIELTTETNENNLFGAEDVRGMTITKQIIPTKADVSAADLNKFLVIHPNEFVFNPRTHGKHIGFGYNDTSESFIISWNNIGFRIKEEMKETVLSEYLFLHFNRNEWDREACFRSWGSSTEVFTWDALCEMELELPELCVQQKYVDIYKAMVANQQSYEHGLEDLKLVCDGYIEDLRRKIPCKKIYSYIEEVSVKNEENIHDANSIRGISINKEFIPTKADTNGISLDNYKIVTTNQFAFNPNTARMGDKICVALNKSSTPYLVSSIYPVFKIIDHDILLPEYLMMWIKRKEFDRYARFNSWGSARETFNFCDMIEVKIPIPEITIQKSIVDIYNTYIKRKEINEQLKVQIKDICPILIQGSLEEGK